MAKKPKQYGEDLELFKDYLRGESSEDAKRPLLHPFFRKQFGDGFKTESDAKGADGYVQGQLILECKSTFPQWIEGFYQALHYHRRHGLAFHTVMVVAHKFVGIWKTDKLPATAVMFVQGAEAVKAPSEVGRENARKTGQDLKNEIKAAARYWLEPKDLEADIFGGAKNLTIESFEILKILKNMESDRLQINPHNFIEVIERMKAFFASPIEAVHAFYAIAAYWQDLTASVAYDEVAEELHVVGFKGQKLSPAVFPLPRQVPAFRKFVESQYLFTNEGSGLMVDYYFSRFDEVLAKIDPGYVKQHGIFFTDQNLCDFSLRFVKEVVPEDIGADYIVFDPAGGSGNLASAWKGRLSHKIVSELQMDMLMIIEKRFKADPYHLQTGFTIVPKTSEKEGLNFLDKTAAEYLGILEKAVRKSTDKAIDKPLAFLVNPPYKNTDENAKARKEAGAGYAIHPSILEHTGEDAGRELYLAFLAQILNLAKEQAAAGLCPLLMVFTPTSWLIPRPTYEGFREVWDASFDFLGGFMVASNEWFKLDGKWPLAFTVWKYNPAKTTTENAITLLDLTGLRQADLAREWGRPQLEDLLAEEPWPEALKIIKKAKKVKLGKKRGDIRDTLPKLQRKGELVQQPRLNIYRNLMKSEEGKAIVSGFPLRDERHKKATVPYGFADGTFVGFMDNNTPVRVRQEPSNRLSNRPDRVWLQLRPGIIDINLTKIQSGTPDKYGYCAYDLPSAKSLLAWFCITKAIQGKYPLWLNQYDLWPAKVKPKSAKAFYSLCFAFALAENRCVVTRFEAGNPVPEAPEVFVDNPMCPANPESFWSLFLEKEMEGGHPAALALVSKIKELYAAWNAHYCKGGYIYHTGLHEEPYFRHFDYPDFLTPRSGLVQIRKFAEQEAKPELHRLFEEIAELTKTVREAVYEMLDKEFGYFE